MDQRLNAVKAERPETVRQQRGNCLAGDALMLASRSNNVANIRVAVAGVAAVVIHHTQALVGNCIDNCPEAIAGWCAIHEAANGALTLDQLGMNGRVPEAHGGV